MKKSISTKLRKTSLTLKPQTSESESEEQEEPHKKHNKDSIEPFDASTKRRGYWRLG
jgi:hypothetical protein